ncbi:hypothetical protein T459_19271 [Capsicum annuum]|uniref:Uncharacterized protein n=1 Tax=Capsicum annuum TaxID=4072 RepID=A0A2G2Z184_CAPAN|nr:hypothetical protein FXO37_20887 [Capsicum annuum]PHT75749.1 hypothetical protein T459_19271 [Capsicum annuum]
MFQVPIVRKTGGLADTVFDMDDQSHAEIANGGRKLTLLTLDVSFNFSKIFPNWAPGAMRRYRVVSLEIENWEIERWRDAELSRCPFLRDLELWRDAREIALRHSKKENYEFEYWRDAL